MHESRSMRVPSALCAPARDDGLASACSAAFAGTWRISVHLALPTEYAALSELRRLAIESSDAAAPVRAAWLTMDPFLIEEGTAQRWVARFEGRVVGAGLRIGENVRALYVLPESQGLGVGRALLHAMEAAAAAEGVTSLWLQSSPEAVRFYERCGWRAGRPATHWHRPADAASTVPLVAVPMWRELDLRASRKDD